MKDKVKIGMISFAHSHAFTFLNELMNRSDVVVTGVYDESRERVQSVTDRYGLTFYGNHAELLAADVDAVVICSENARHAPLALDAAAAGKHVLCEKPLATTIADMRAMIAACRDSGVQLMTAYPCRYLPAVAEAKTAVDRGEIGRLLAIKGTNRGRMSGRWFVDRALSGGGAIMDHTVHLMDLMNWFTGSVPVEVYAEAGTLFHRELDVEDAAMIHVRYADGVIGVLDPSWSRVPSYPGSADVAMHVIGTDGAIELNAFAQRNEVYRNDKPRAEWSYWGDGMERFMIGEFVEAVKEGRNVAVTGEDGLRSAAVAVAAYESSRTGKPVPLVLS
ncbi:Gfo/Idh/MocA family protein [Paenibacillus sp. GYB003]|uniref:Gfo/Idh/MocA family protein n=1 Tax=Paenibacillus sp. GYB003 TaxID=2994392 RepID=UPI002F96E77E